MDGILDLRMKMNYSVKELLNEISKNEKSVNIVVAPDQNTPHEAHILKLDISKAVFELGWKPLLDFKQTVEFTVSGYLNDINKLSALFEDRVNTIKRYTEIATKHNMKWSEK